MMNKELTIDKEKAYIYAEELTTLFHENKVEDTLNILMGFTTALVKVAAEVKKNTHGYVDDATERIVLTWIKNMDKASGLNFGKYIDVHKIS
jgi:hypothetical protein